MTNARTLIYVYIPDMLSDWEPSYVLPELNSGQFFKKGAPAFTVKTCAPTLAPVTTMGGLRVVPDLTVDEIDAANCALLLLPGSYKWMEPGHDQILAKTRECLDRGVTVGAICAATLALAQAGLLDTHRHTSNDLPFMKQICPQYRGGDLYQEQSAVTDGNLITARGTAPLEFACAIFKKLDVFSPETLEAWYQL